MIQMIRWCPLLRVLNEGERERKRGGEGGEGRGGRGRGVCVGRGAVCPHLRGQRGVFLLTVCVTHRVVALTAVLPWKTSFMIRFCLLKVLKTLRLEFESPLRLPKCVVKSDKLAVAEFFQLVDTRYIF